MRHRTHHIGSFDYTPIVTIGAVGLIAYFILNKIGLFGSQSNAGNNQSIDQGTASANQGAYNTAVNSGSQRTLNDSRIQSLASDIYNQGVSGNPPSSMSQNYIVGDVVQTKTDADWYALKVSFGTKQAATSAWSTCALLGFNCQSVDLDAWLKLTLTEDNIADINNYFSYQGINYQL